MSAWQHDPIYFGPLKKLGGGWIAFKDAGSPPAAPDYTGAAVAQGAANKESAIATAQLGNPNVTSPYGNQSVSYQNDPTTGNPVPYVNQTLNPQSQQIFNQQQAVKLGLANLGQQGLWQAQNVLGKPFDMSGVAKSPVNAGMTGQQAIMDRLAPQQARDRTSLETQLTNQGLRPGSEAWTNGMGDLGRQQNDAQSQAALYGINLDTAAHQQGIQEQGYLRDLPINEITALMSGSQIQNPQFQQLQGAQVQPGNTQAALGQQAQYNQGLYNSQVGQANSFNSGLATLGSAAMMAFSDRRLKSNIQRIGTHPLGIGIYEFTIFGRREQGVMADEVFHVKPEAVSMHPSGYLQVAYGRL